MQEGKVALNHRDAIPREPAELTEERFDWYCQTVGLLSDLTNVLSETIDQLNTFFTTGGDMMYFHDTGTSAVSSDANRWLIDIKQAIWQLETLQRRVSYLRDSCTRDRTTVRLTPINFGESLGGISCTNS
jgi:hypothetical protein